MRTMMLTLPVFLAATIAAASDVTVEPASTDKTAKAAYQFTLQKGIYKYDGYRLWGKLTDADGKPVRGTVVFVVTAYGPKGDFLARASTQLGSERSDDSVLGHINNLALETDGVRPSKVVWRVISEQEAAKKIKSIRSKEKTASDTSLEFTVQGISKGYRGLQIYGKVTNAGTDSFQSLNVIVTAYDAKGKFISRGRSSVSPSKVGPGEVGYVDQLSIDTQGKTPAKFEWKVIKSDF
jgi:hypothetical protein